MKFKLDGINPVMGCYGVGVSRLVGAVLEIFGQENSIDYPPSIAPFQIYLFGSNRDICEKLHSIWPEEIYYDDSARSFGEYNAVSMLLGAPYKILVGDKKIGPDSIQINKREYSLEQTIDFIRKLLKRPNLS